MQVTCNKRLGNVEFSQNKASYVYNNEVINFIKIFYC